MTYNIHKGIGGLDRKYRIQRVIDVLQACHADLILLQEVDDGVPRSRGHRQVDVIGEELGLAHRVYAPNVRLRQGRYGNAILSRFPLDSDDNIDLTIPPKKRRGALHARMTLDRDTRHSQRMWVFNVHLGLSGLERRAQMRRLLKYLSKHHAPLDAGIVIGGDFNDMFHRLGTLIMEPAGFQGPAVYRPTFPAARPVRALDRVYVRGPLAIRRQYPSRKQLARDASDHLPVLCIVERS